MSPQRRLRHVSFLGFVLIGLSTLAGPVLGQTGPVPEPNATFLDDMKETSFEAAYGSLGKHGNTAFPPDAVQKFRLRGVLIPHALGFTPGTKSPGFVRYDLGGRFNRFRATVALNRAVPEDGLEAIRKLPHFNGLVHSLVTFRVFGDGKELWKSQPLVRLGDYQECDVAIPDVKELKLEVQSADSAAFAWTYFANPRVMNLSAEAAATPPPSPPAIVETDVIYLDDMRETKFELDYGKLGQHGKTTGDPKQVQRFRLNGVEPQHTLSVHPRMTLPGYVKYDLDGRHDRFRATAALNIATFQDGMAGVRKLGYNGVARTPVYFRVMGDGKLLWESKPLQKLGESEECDVSVAGVKELHLEASAAKEPNFAWAFWMNPRVFKAQAAETTKPATPPPATAKVTPPTPPKVADSGKPTAPAPSPAKPSPTPTPTAPATASTTPKPADTGKPKAPESSPAKPTPTPTPAPTATAATVPTVPEGTVLFTPLDLGQPVAFMAPTEDGQFLIFSHTDANKLTVWDIAASKIAKTIDTPAPRCLLCRGDTVFVGHAREGTIRSFSRKANWKLQDELVVKKAPIQHLSAPQGEYFKGEILVTCHGNPSGIIRLDTAKDKAQDVSGSTMATVSYDGKLVMTQSSFSNSPSGQVSIYAYSDFLAGKPRAIIEGGDQQTPYLYQVRPGPHWFGADIMFAGPTLTKVATPGGTMAIADVTRPALYHLSAKQLGGKSLGRGFPELETRPVAWSRQESLDQVFMHVYRRRSYLLDAPYASTRNGKLDLFCVNNSNGVVWSARTTPLGEGSAVASTSTPKSNSSSATESKSLGLPDRVAEGSPFTHKLTAPPKSEFELMKGPDGAKLSTKGELTWTPAKSEIGTHELKVRVTTGADVSIIRQSIEVIDRELLAKSGGSTSTAGQGQRLPLEFDHYQLLASPDYKSLLLLQGDWLRVLQPDGIKVARESKLQSRYMRIDVRPGTSGEDTVVALINNPPQLELMDFKTGKVRKSIPLQKSDVRVLEVVDYAVHPQRPVTYVTVKHDIELPRYRILVVDEATGKIESPDDAIATWVKVDSSGQYLYAAYRDLYTRGVKFHMNPGWNLISTPQYGNVDWLLTFEIRGQKLKFVGLVPEAGGNGNGIVLSPDGKRITYLSHVGTPLHSGNLVAWNPRKLKDEPVTYATKDRGTTKQLAFHPTLNLVAVPGSGSAVIFDRESGKILPNKLQMTASGLDDAKVEQLLFSPDGQGLIFVCTDLESGRYLRRVDLRLTDAEKATAANGLTVRGPSGTGEPGEGASVATAKNLIKVKPDEIDALKKSAGTASQTSAEISRRFLNSVVVIESDEGGGTGFIVGTKGYVLTCAHVLPDNGVVNVTYNTLAAGKPKSVTLKARPVRIDPERDLALLKITTEHELTSVAMSDTAVEAGESVTVIGNPGLGKELLKHTVTTGVVSSTERDLDGQKFIQTSAAVNAGNSGGPVFGAKGQIVGLVVLKANLEATAFAVPAEELRQFLREATDATK